MTCNVPNGATRTWKIRRLTFHPSQYSSCNGVFFSFVESCFFYINQISL